MATVADEQVTVGTATGSRLSQLIFWLLPRRADLLIFLCCLIVVVGLIDPFLDQQLFRGSWGKLGRGKLGLCLGVCAACLAAIGVAAGWRKLEFRSGMAVVISCCIAIAAFLWANFEVMRTWKIGSSAYYDFDQSPLSEMYFSNESVGIFLAQSVGVVIAGMLIVFLLTRGILLFLMWISQSTTNQVKLSKTQLLIGLAVILFIAKTIQDVYFSTGFLYSFRAFSSSGFWGRMVIGLTAFVILFALPSWVLTSNVKPRWKFLLMIVLTTGFIATYIIRVNVVQPRIDEHTFTVVNMLAVFAFYPTLLLVCKTGSQDLARATKRIVPTIWSLVPTLMLIGFVGLAYYVNISMFVQNWIFEWPDIWEAPIAAKSVARKSDFQIGVVGTYGLRGLVANLDSNTDPDVFSNFKSSYVNLVKLKNANPNVDVSNLYGIGGVTIEGGELTAEQLNGMLRATTSSVLIYDLKVVDPKPIVTIPISFQMRVAFSKPGLLDSFAASLKPNKNAFCWLSLSEGALNESTAESVTKLGDKMFVYIDNETFKLIANSDFDRSSALSNVVIRLGSVGNEMVVVPEIGTTEWKFLLESEVFVTFRASDVFWDLAFAKGRDAMPQYWGATSLESFQNRETLLRDAIKNHWNFSSDKSTAKRLFIPGTELSLGSNPLVWKLLVDAEVLSFDPGWLSASDPYTDMLSRSWGAYQGGFNFNGIEALTKLKRLDLNPYLEIGDALFLQQIPNIEHLQIRFAKAEEQFVDFRRCPKLKTLVYFGVPSDWTLTQLKKHKSLQSLTIVEGSGGELTEQDRLDLEKLLSKLSVRFLSEKEYQPSPPPEFVTHANETSMAIRKRWNVGPRKPDQGQQKAEKKAEKKAENQKTGK